MSGSLITDPLRLMNNAEYMTQNVIHEDREYQTEEEVGWFFDSIISKSNDFYVLREVTGCYTQPKPFSELRAPRIDRLLIPKEKLRSKGWPHYCVGIELKAGGLKLGRALSQSMDYTRAVFTSHEFCCDIMPRYVFMFNTCKQHGQIASVSAQHRVGFCEWKYNQLTFFIGEMPAFSLRGGEVCDIKDISSGWKTGSR